MLRLLLAALVLLHGIIHFAGVVKAFGIAPVPALSAAISRPAGMLWGVAGALFIGSGIVLLQGNGRWWMLAALAIVISQALIVFRWQDARFGTIANVLVLVAVIAGVSVWHFRSRYTALAENTLSATRALPAQRIREADLLLLPLPVQRYLRAAGVVGTLRPRSMRIVFTGEIRGFDGPWMPFTSVQTNRFDEPARFFWMDATMMGMPTKGLHAYANGTASMLIKLLGVVPVMEAHGPEMDQAETVTWFNDLCIYAPAALTDPRITWTAVDDRSATATFTHHGRSIRATLVFDADDRLVDFVSDDRYALSEGEAKSMRFSTPLRDHHTVNGLVLPGFGETVWHRPEGPFVYGRFTLRSLTYNE